jgi:Ca2+/Na+ antiporter
MLAKLITSILSSLTASVMLVVIQPRELEQSRAVSVLTVFFLTSLQESTQQVVLAIVLYCMCKLYLQHRYGTAKTHTQPAVLTPVNLSGKTQSTQTQRETVPILEVV